MNNYAKIEREILNNFSNIEIIGLIDDILSEMIQNIEDLNEENEKIAGDYLIDYDLGNNNYIKTEDLETLVSTKDTLRYIESYNKE